METVEIHEDQTGCWLDSHRGHYISRDAIELAVGWGFIIGPFEQYAIGMYDDHWHEQEYPVEGLQELCDEAVEWLNSGQDECQVCCTGVGDIRPGQVSVTTFDDNTGHVTGHVWVICRACSGSGRGPRIDGQNFPPKVPEGYTWSFEDGDFGLWKYDDEGLVFE